MEVYALLTGRGNNTLKDKNVRECLGHPVLYYPAVAAQCAKTVSKLFCSSDDEKILSEAEKLGHERIQRPTELATPTSQHIDCIMHGLKVIGERGEFPDILVVTLANNVTIKSEWIDDCVEMMMEDMSISSVIPVYADNDHHPLRAKKVDANGRLQMYEQDVKGNISTNRQDLPSCYFCSHNFWVLNVQQLLDTGGRGQQPWGFMGDNIAYYIVEESIDIHKESDLYVASEWIKENYTDIFAGGYFRSSRSALGFIMLQSEYRLFKKLADCRCYLTADLF